MQVERLAQGGPALDGMFREVLEHLPGAVYVQRREGSATTTYITPQVEELFGAPARVLIESTDAWTKRVHPDDHARMWDEDARADATGTYRCEYRLRGPDGTYRWFRDEARRYTDVSGALLWIGVLADIDEEKQHEREMQEALTRFRALAEQIPAVTYIEPLGGPARPTYMSPQYEQMFGYSPQERLADPTLWERTLHPDDRERVMAEIDEIGEDADGWSLEYRMIHRDGHVVWVRDQAVKVADAAGTPLYYLAVLFDITDNRRVQEELAQTLEELRRADDVKNTFLTAVSHDLRTPLATILGNAVTLEHAEELGLTADEQREMLRSLSAKAQRLTALITDLLDVDRLTRGALTPREGLEELSGVIEGVVADAEYLGTRTVHLELRPTVVMVDRSMIERIVANLLENAAKHTHGSASVWVQLRPVGDGAEIVVADDGDGVPAALRESLFRPFERGPSANPQSPGVGLGLSLVARFAELHGGRAWVQERAGGGAEFHVLVPGAHEDLPAD
jgi:PAS domain S-box-containing protein